LALASIIPTLGTAAHAEDAPFPEPTPTPRETRAIDGHRVLASFELLGLAEKQVALQVETPITMRDSIAIGGFYMHNRSSGDADFFSILESAYYDTQTEALGADLQWRHYFGNISRVGRGFYVAPGVELQRFRAVTADCEYAKGFFPTVTQDTCGYGHEQSWWYVGPSLDLGGQYVTRVGFIFGAAFGLQYRFATENVGSTARDWLWSAENGEGLRPRMRLTAGWAFL
jgi:hypothetical protein